MKSQLTLTALALILSTTFAANTALAAGTDTDGDGVPDISEPLLHTDPMNPDTDGDGTYDLKDDAPVLAADPFTGSASTPTPFHIGEVLVENNVDPVAHKDAPDHLEIQVINDGQADLTGFTLYYTLTDADTGDKEAYILHPAVTVPAGGEARVHVDDSGAADHLRANPNSIYLTSQAAKHVTVTLGVDGSAPVMASVEKDAGGAEQAD